MNSNRESGVALLVVLVLMLVSGLLGSTAFKDSSVSLQLANNDQQREVAFRAAEGAVNRMLDPVIIRDLVNSDQQSIEDNTSILPQAKTETRLKLDGIGLARGYSLGEGVGTFVPYKFTANATATLQGVSATSTVIQGAEQFVPKAK